MNSGQHYPGKGCECFASSAGECCCDGVDWRSAREVELEAENKRLRSEVAHWKKNHAAEVERARVLKERLDMPFERVLAYEKYKALQSDYERLLSSQEKLGEPFEKVLLDNLDSLYSE